MKLKVLGPGCANCQKLEQLARSAALDLGAQADLEKVTELDKIMEYPIMATPGLVINEQLVCAGRLPSPEEVTAWIRQALAQDEG